MSRDDLIKKIFGEIIFDPDDINLNIFLLKDLDLERENFDLDSIERKCPECGKSLQEIRISSQCGCSYCYKFFEKDLKRLLKSKNRLKNINYQNEIKLRNLQRLIDISVINEDFDKAKYYYDLYTQAKGSNNKNGGKLNDSFNK